MSADAQPTTTDGDAIARREWLAAAAAALVVLAAFNVRLGTPALWGDEADTANYARSIRAHGLPRAVLGRNVLAFEDCFQLSDALLPHRLPWGQYYVAAASMALFGDDTAGARRLFAIVAALSVFPLWAVLRRRVPWAPAVAAVLLLAPQSLLFARQARYYPLAIAILCTLAWNLDSGPRSARGRWAVSVASLVLLFHVHPLLAAATAVAACLHAAIADRPRWRELAVASASGAASWGAWYLSMRAAPSSQPSPLRLLREDPSAWLARSGTGLVSGVRDLDHVGTLPLVAWAAVLAAAWILRRRDGGRREPLPRAAVFALLAVAIPVGAVAAAVGVERGDLAALRYLPHAAVLAPLALVLVAAAALGPARGAAVAVAALAVNWGSVGHWARPATLPPQPASWWPPVYAEVLASDADDVAALARTVRERAPAPADGPVGVFPWYASDVYVFYLGDRFTIAPYVEERSACSRLLERAVGAPAWEAMLRTPTVVVAQSPMPLDWPDAERWAVPLRRAAYDGTRPELTRHEFPAPGSAGEAAVLVSRAPGGR